MTYLQSLLETIFLFFYGLFHSYGGAGLCLSIAVTVLLTPLYFCTSILENREALMRERLRLWMDKINLINNPQIRHKHLSKLYKSYAYQPIYSLRSLSSLLIQIPFFIAAYNFLSHFDGFNGAAFLFIKDLGKADALLFGMNLLPILMTLINFAAAFFMTDGRDYKERRQTMAIAVFFLIILYTSPSGLVLYWTFNNLINALRYFWVWAKGNNLLGAISFRKTAASSRGAILRLLLSPVRTTTPSASPTPLQRGEFFKNFIRLWRMKSTSPVASGNLKKTSSQREGVSRESGRGKTGVHINWEIASAFLLFCVLYFSINLYSFGAYTRENSHLLWIILIPLYIALFIKTFFFIMSNRSKAKQKSFIIRIVLISLLFIVSFVVYQYEKIHYLLAVLLLLSSAPSQARSLCLPDYRLPIEKIGLLKTLFAPHLLISASGIFSAVKTSLKSSGICIAIMLFPAVLYMKSNAVYFGENDMLPYFAVLIIFAAALPHIAFYLNKISLKTTLFFSISFIIAAMFLPMIREASGYPGDMPIDFLFVFLIVLFIVGFFKGKEKMVVIFFLAAALWTGGSYILGIGDIEGEINGRAGALAPTKTLRASAGPYEDIAGETHSAKPPRQTAFDGLTPLHGGEIYQELLDLDMKDHAAIYLFMHDSFPHKGLALALGLDYSEIENFLTQKDFKIYDVYSIGYYTNISMTSLFDIYDHRVDEYEIDELHQGRRIMSGDNFVNLLLQNKGYLTAIAGEDDLWTYQEEILALGLTAGKRGAQNQVLLGIMQGRLNTILLKHRREGSAAYQAAEFANENAGKDKIFAYGAAGPDHSSLSLDLAAELKTWSVKYYNAVADIKKEVELALKENPNAIIIVMSDHGPWMLGNPRKDYEGKLETENGAAREMFFRDKYGAFMAIRWGDKQRAAKYDKDFHIIQDLFPIVFAYLYDSPIPLKYKIKNTDVRIGKYKFDKGILSEFH